MIHPPACADHRTTCPPASGGTASLGIVVPVLDEAVAIGPCLDRLAAGLAGLPGPRRPPVLVVDGGSRDGTAALAVAHPSAPIVRIEGGGRHRQLNRALIELTTAWLLILPVDARLPTAAWPRLLARCACLPGPAACLRMHPADRRWHHRARARFAGHRARCGGGAYIDQVPLLHRASALAVGGFRAYGTYDTAELGRRLARFGPLILLPQKVAISCRDYQAQGFWRTTLRQQRQRWRFLWRPRRLQRSSSDSSIA